MTRSIAFRLNLWYALTFLLSVGALFVALYFLVAEAAQRQDREIVEARLKESPHLPQRRRGHFGTGCNAATMRGARNYSFA